MPAASWQLATTGLSDVAMPEHGLNRPDHRPEHAPYREWELTSPPAQVREMVAHLVSGPAQGYAHDVRRAIRANRPGLVLTSFSAFGAMIAAEAAGTPFDVLMPDIYPLPAPG